MEHLARLILLVGVALALAVSVRSQPVVINEIMFHPLQPAFGAEPVREEYVELFNASTNAISLDDWRIDRGVTFAFSNVTLAANAYLVVAADRSAFTNKYPGVTNVVGGWQGTLANNGEEIRLVDAQGQTVDRVSYAAEGDWATRQRGPRYFNHRGWKWYAPADGLGFSLQRRNPHLADSSGPNWQSTNPTPGRVNACFSTNVAPLILDAAHSPLVPKSTQQVFVTARLVDEQPDTTTATLFHRNDAVAPPAFTSRPMWDDGQHGDGLAGDGVFGVAIPAQAHNTVVEFYMLAADATGRTNRWPALPIPAADQTNLPSRLPNALYQVDDSVYTGTQPLYKLIMIESERAELASLPCTADQDSNAEMNGTFISVTGTGAECRYFCGFRNRGHVSRCAPTPNYRVNFPGDRPWKGTRELNINAENTHVQVLGSALARKSGVAGYDSRAAQVRVNNANLAGVGADMYGSYAANEIYDSGWTERHFPGDGDGNLYRANREIPPADFVWRGSDPSAYTNTYFKASNASENDWSDLIQLHRILGAEDQFTTGNIRAVANVEQWMSHLAVMALLADAGTALNTGYNDDYYLYRGTADARFILLYHDLGAILGVLDPDLGHSTTNLDIFSNTANNGAGTMLNRFLHAPDFEPIYYATLQRLLNTTFSEAQFNALVEQTFASYPQTTALTAMMGNLKLWMNARRAYVQAAIAGHVPPETNRPVATISGEPRSPTPFISASLTVGGSDITRYRFRLNGGAWSGEQLVVSPIQLSALAHGSTNAVQVIGRNSAGLWQPVADATLSRAWIVNTNTPAVRLNEVLARNDSAVNHHGVFPDLIELHNEGAVTADLSGLALTDDPAEPGRFTFPDHTTLAAGECLVVIAHDADGTPGFHLGFALNQDGDAVYLCDRATNGGGVLDSVAFGPQLADRSIGRLGAGGEWRMCSPAFGATNTALTLGDPATLKINEWLAVGAPPFTDDFIELYNPDPRPIALGGLFLSDEPFGAPTRHAIAPLSFVAGGGHCVFLADGNPDAGPSHLSFRLSSDVAELSLKARDLSSIDHVNCGPQRADASQGRCPDGSLKITTLSQPTPGYANFCPGPPPGPPLLSLIAVTNVWRYNQDGSELGGAWKEVNFDDSLWPAGPALLGRLRDSPYAYVPESILTPLSVGTALTYYFRAHFTVGSLTNFTALQISNVIDDGALFYVNGTNVGRFNMPTGPVSASTPASSSVTDAAWRGPIAVPTNLVHEGDNVLAVEVHQFNIGSTDVIFGLRLDRVMRTSTPQAAGVVINEVLADNVTVIGPGGSMPDWVEIYNPSTNTVDLGNMSLSDSTGEPRRWVFPSPTLLLPQAFLVVRCDADAPASATNTGFGLKATGDSVYLFNNPAWGSNVIDSVSFGLQTADFSIGRVPAGSSNWVLSLPTAGTTNYTAPLGDPAHLRINEWMALPASGEDWFELFNPDPQPVALGGLWLSDALGSTAARMKSRVPPLSFLGCATNAFQRFHADRQLNAGADHADFRLDGTYGEEIGVSFAEGTLIHGVSFMPQQTGVSEGFLPDGTANLVRFANSPSPGEANYLLLTNVVINEVLAHSRLPLEDAIELRNLAAAPLDLSGWYLSDSKANLRKFRITNGTFLPGDGFKVFYEYQFNHPDLGASAFALSSAKGDQVFLSEATNGQLTGWRAQVSFGPSENGVSFGRHETSVGADFAAMSALSFGTAITASHPTNHLVLFRNGQGAPNPYPRVGPVIISQIMYHPPDIVSGGTTNDNVVEEFIELRNIAGSPLSLYDPAHPTNGWRLRDAVEFQFAAGHVISSGGHLLVVSFDPLSNSTALAAFRARYGSNFTLVGPYSGRLDNAGESVELVKPDAPQPDGHVPAVLVEKVVYQDHAPWPTSADGHGASLQRVSFTGYANDPTNWIAAPPAPGLPGLLDRDSDGMPDDWEIHHGFDPNNAADAAVDADGDGQSNWQEFLAGTDPRDRQSYLKVDCPGVTGDQVSLQFLAMPWKTYTVLYRDAADHGPWMKLADVVPHSTTQVVTVFDESAGGMSHRFYRLVTPALPPPSR